MKDIGEVTFNQEGGEQKGMAEEKMGQDTGKVGAEKNHPGEDCAVLWRELLNTKAFLLQA